MLRRRRRRRINRPSNHTQTCHILHHGNGTTTGQTVVGTPHTTSESVSDVALCSREHKQQNTLLPLLVLDMLTSDQLRDNKKTRSRAITERMNVW